MELTFSICSLVKVSDEIGVVSIYLQFDCLDDSESTLLLEFFRCEVSFVSEALSCTSSTKLEGNTPTYRED